MFVCENKNVRSQLLDEERMRLVSAFVCMGKHLGEFSSNAFGWVTGRASGL